MADDTTCKLCGGPYPSKRTGNGFGKADTPVDIRVYHGPEGHCPDDVCADCWHGVWADAEARWAKEQDGTQAFAVLYAIKVEGRTYVEMSQRTGVPKSTLHRHCQKYIKQNGKNAPSRVCTIRRGS